MTRHKSAIILDQMTYTGTVPAGQAALIYKSSGLVLREGTTDRVFPTLNGQFNSLVVGASYVDVESPPENGVCIEGKFGINFTSPTASLYVKGSLAMNVTEVDNANYQTLWNDATIFVTTGNTDRTITLPDPTTSRGHFITIIKVDSGTGNVIVDAYASETINGASTYSLTEQYQSASFKTGGVNWYKTGGNL